MELLNSFFCPLPGSLTFFLLLMKNQRPSLVPCPVHQLSWCSLQLTRQIWQASGVGLLLGRRIPPLLLGPNKYPWRTPLIVAPLLRLLKNWAILWAIWDTSATLWETISLASSPAYPWPSASKTVACAEAFCATASTGLPLNGLGPRCSC